MACEAFSPSPVWEDEPFPVEQQWVSAGCAPQGARCQPWPCTLTGGTWGSLLLRGHLWWGTEEI